MPLKLRSCVCCVFVVAAIVAAAGARAQHHGARAEAIYFVGDFETCDFSQWKQAGPTKGFRIARSRHVQGRCAGALKVSGANPGMWSPGSDATAVVAPAAEYGTIGHTVWQHFSILFPRRFESTYGEWNWITEWHNDAGFRPFVSSGQINWEYPNLCWTIRNSGRVQRLAMRILGGSSRTPWRVWVNGPVLKRDHWYDFLVRTTWSPSRSEGFVEWWLDGKRLFSAHAATLYTRPDGSVSSVYFMQDYYRLHAKWPATTFFDGTRLGSSRKSVRYGRS